ncbi:MAG: SoxR reducing system RseC family protein [Betaproteobacteria bacterium]|nr:SoxR reducing system RseC family protein [Betaproteobacteria bacterium]
MEQEAIVARVEGEEAIVELLSNGNGCGRCQETGGCQSGLMNRLFCDKPRQYRLRNRFNAVAGERVVVQVADAVPLRAAVLAYLVPAGLIVAGAWAAASLAEGNDAATALGAGLGLAIAAFIARLAKYRHAAMTGWHPIIVRRSDMNCLEKESCR